MKTCKSLLLVFFAMGALMAQQKAQKDINMGMNRVAKGYDYLDTAFPKDITVFKMDKSKHVLKLQGLTLLQVWTMRDGARPELWEGFHGIARKFKDQGLKSLSINFENGTDFNGQHYKLGEFFRAVPEPENFYFDSLGYVTDLLKVPGFPIYYLVDAKGKIVFRTLGEDEEGVAMLEEEIRTRLTKKS